MVDDGVQEVLLSQWGTGCVWEVGRDLPGSLEDTLNSGRDFEIAAA